MSDQRPPSSGAANVRKGRKRTVAPRSRLGGLAAELIEQEAITFERHAFSLAKQRHLSAMKRGAFAPAASLPREQSAQLLFAVSSNHADDTWNHRRMREGFHLISWVSRLLITGDEGLA